MKELTQQHYEKNLFKKDFEIYKQVWCDENRGYEIAEHPYITSRTKIKISYIKLILKLKDDKLYWLYSDDIHLIWYVVVKDSRIYYYNALEHMDIQDFEILDRKVHELHERGIHYKTSIEIAVL